MNSKREYPARRFSESRAKSTRRRGKLLRILSLPESTSENFPCIRMIGDAHVEIENHKGVLELTRTVIRLHTCLGILRISGNKLEVRNADRECLLIDGCICSIEYEKH